MTMLSDLLLVGIFVLQGVLVLVIRAVLVRLTAHAAPVTVSAPAPPLFVAPNPGVSLNCGHTAHEYERDARGLTRCLECARR